MVAFDEREDLFFGLTSNPSEQVNLMETAMGDVAKACDEMVKFVRGTTNFDEILETQAGRQKDLANRYKFDSQAYLPNQYMLGSGRIIEAEQTLYRQAVVTDDGANFFNDWPEGKT